MRGEIMEGDWAATTANGCQPVDRQTFHARRTDGTAERSVAYNFTPAVVRCLRSLIEGSVRAQAAGHTARACRRRSPSRVMNRLRQRRLSRWRFSLAVRLSAWALLRSSGAFTVSPTGSGLVAGVLVGLGLLRPANTSGFSHSSRAAAIGGPLRRFPAGWVQLIAGDAPPPLPPGSPAPGRLRAATHPLRAGAVGGGAAGAVV